MNRKIQKLKYLLLDYISAIITWSLFFFYRKYNFNPSFFEDIAEVTKDANLWRGISIIPLFWIALNYFSGFYRKIYRRSRLQELWETISVSFIGVLFIFFILILDDIILDYTHYYKSFSTLFLLQFIFTYSFRLLLTNSITKKIHNKIYGFKTVIIGGGSSACNIYQEIENQKKSSGNKFIGFLTLNQDDKSKLEKSIPSLGKINDLRSIVKCHEIEEVIIALEDGEREEIENIIASIEDTNVIIKIKADLKDVIMGSVKTSSIFQTPLIEISPDYMPIWQQSIKRFMDIILSAIAILLLIPIYVFTAIGVKLSSKGPIFYSQKRVGIYGKEFMMHKFRSMYIDAEKDGKPRLSSDHDPRITPFGRFMRKVRLDEIPQFYSVLIGDMSLVGPRPERQYFIDKISEKAPHYRLLHKIKPGITSWGQVKYGYASDVDQMVERMKFDLLYIENMSLLMDIKILIYTVLIVVQGRGK